MREVGVRPVRLVLLALAVLLSGCAVPAEPPRDFASEPHREHWLLTHRVPASSGVRVVGQRMDAFAESTQVSFGTDPTGSEVLCIVSVNAPGQGGPENKVGEKVPTTVQGRPAVRNGAGAEGDYLTWQRSDGAWVESQCGDEGQQSFQDELAELVEAAPSTLVLPFDVTLPRGLGVTSVEQDGRSGTTTVRLAGVATDLGNTSSELVLTFDDDVDRPAGRATEIAGHPASVDESPTSPGLCLVVQDHDVCVDADSDDTGPYPDRSDELPVMTAVAEALTYPSDLDDRSSWYPAQDVFG